MSNVSSINPPYPIFTDVDGNPLESGYIYIGTAALDPVSNPKTVYWDAAATIPASQPIRTSGGYPVRSGSPARLYVDSDYSILVKNKNGSFVYSAPNVTDRFGDAVINVGSDKVSFLQSGVGAVQRTAQSKMREWISVKDFGAVGDGSNDDTASVQAAFTEANGTKAVLFPDGSYKITSSIDCKGSPFFGQSMHKSIVLCQVTNDRTFKNGGQTYNDITLNGTGFATADGISIGGYLDYFTNCAFIGLRDAICPTGIIVTSTVDQCLFLGCNSAISDKLTDGTSAHTTLWFKSNSVQYGNKAFDMKTQTAGFLFDGNVFEDLYYVWYAYGGQIFNSVWMKNWVEQVYKDCELYHNCFDGSTNVHIMNDLRPGSKTITDIKRWSSGQWSLGGEAQGGGGGTVIDTGGIRLNNFNGNGFLLTEVGCKPSAAQANYSLVTDFVFETQQANANATSRGGDFVLKTAAGSNGARKGALRTYDDNGTQLGDASNRWSVVYAGTGTINTSDANEKDQIRQIEDAEKQVAAKIKSLFKAFKFKDAVQLKGDSARTHFGVIAQEVEQAFAECGLNADEYSLFCRDVWYTAVDSETEETVIVYPDQDGKYPQDAVRHERLGVRYEELLSFVISVL